MIPKSRIDALTDGVFAFATTLLVLDLCLPEAFNPASSAELIGAIKELQGQFTAYIISFAVLGLRWLAQSTSRGVPETVSRKYGFWMLVYLFFITCIPFSTMVIGRYNDFAPASWLYAANMMLSALATLRLSSLPEETTNRPLDNQARLGGAVLFCFRRAVGCPELLYSPLRDRCLRAQRDPVVHAASEAIAARAGRLQAVVRHLRNRVEAIAATTDGPRDPEIMANCQQHRPEN
jgi:uncharacterized membrane protein